MQETKFDLVPVSLQEAISFSDMISKSAMIPKEYHNRPADILIAIQYGMELGLKPLQALQSIACINGKPCIFGDAMLGVIQASPLYEWHDESESDANHGVCIVKRKGVPPVKGSFTLEDAKRAGLLGKSGPWTQYTSRMLKMRARGFALRDAFSDVLKGIVPSEEAMDMPVESVTATLQPEVPAETLLDKLKKQAETAGMQPQVPPAELPAPTEKPAPKDAKPTARKAPAKADPKVVNAGLAQTVPHIPEPPKTKAPPANLVAYNDYLAGFDGIPVTDTEKAIALMKSACEDIRLLDGDYAKLEDFFYGRYATIKRPGK